MIRVWAPSRLHFGLLSLAADGAAWPDRLGRAVLPSRRFGGAGLMIDAPGVRVSASAASDWSADGASADRALAFARHFTQYVESGHFGVTPTPQRLVVEQAPLEHVGLGMGTQLGLAVGRALAGVWSLDLDAVALARAVGRGLRSALGVYGFERGGFLVESGKGAADSLASLAARVAFPPAWRLVLATPPGPAGLHGSGEREAFAHLPERPDALAQTDALCRLALLGMLPALAEADLDAFGEALYDFNARVGEIFAPIQGGLFAGPRVAECVEFLRGQGCKGVGQSSWGPTVFAVVGDEDRAANMVRRLAGRFGLGPGGAWTAAACNGGARVEAG
jgi:beta-RFAP synthase